MARPIETTVIEDLMMQRFPGDNYFSTCEWNAKDNVITMEVGSSIVKDVIRFMKEDETLNCNFLTDLCGVHYPDNEKDRQFAVVYLLHNWIENIRIRIKVFLNGDNPTVDTVTDVFASANWMERETYDFYGIVFLGHPKLKRILNDEGMISFPMRKEFPLEDSSRTDKDDRFFGRTPDNYDPNTNK